MSWTDVPFARTVPTGGRSTTVTDGATLVMGAFETRGNQLMAVATLASLPSLAVFLLLQRRLTRGVAATLHGSAPARRGRLTTSGRNDGAMRYQGRC